MKFTRAKAGASDKDACKPPQVHTTLPPVATTDAVTSIQPKLKKKNALTASVSAAGGNVRRKMQRFSIANVMGRKSGANDSDAAARPSVVSVNNLNKQLNDEVKNKSDIHLFFGPQQGIFEGRDRPRVLHGERKIQKNAKKFWLMSEPLSLDRDSTTSIVGFPTDQPAKTGGIASTLSAAGRFIGQKVAQMKLPSSHVNEDSFCDGCGMDPIVGNMYTCSTCDNYSLCESCYQTGIHGYEESELLKNVREDFALRHIVEHCRNRVPEKVFEVLMKKVCKGQVDKFNFLAKWISSVVLGHPLNELSVRGIEIPHLDMETRTTLVELLTPVLAERTDIEVCMEWFCPDADKEDLPNSRRKLETLRIWVATDKDSKSPFASKDTVKEKEADTESDMSPSSPREDGPGSPVASDGDFIGSPPASPRNDDPISPPASPQFNALSVSHSQDFKDYDSDSDRRSECSVIEPKAVSGVTECGKPSGGIEM
ncbi:hypothetical protein ATCC90586_008525 [Pythium insidiosum]|nr:hypothetical protein ATCC90586_008525 [Pythium insidiosum]